MNEIPKELLDTVCHTTTVESFLSICGYESHGKSIEENIEMGCEGLFLQYS